MNYRQKVARNFSRASTTYHEAAKLQKESVYRLALEFNEIEGESKILEIGSGTGFLTELLIKKYPLSHISAVDISCDMLKKLSDYLKNYSSLYSLVIADGQQLPFSKKNLFDLICSASSFQWFENLSESFKTYFNLLKKDGRLIFSMYGNSTFKELKHCYKKVFPGMKCGQDIEDFESVEKYLNNIGYHICSSESQEIVVYYKRLNDFFINQKETGALNVYNNAVVSKSGWKRLMDCYSKYYKDSQGYKVTYSFYYFNAEKK